MNKKDRIRFNFILVVERKNNTVKKVVWDRDLTKLSKEEERRFDNRILKEHDKLSLQFPHTQYDVFIGGAQTKKLKELQVALPELNWNKVVQETLT
ncbi:MAG: hypothetical protein G01um101470_248 [Parcubacteria group bacterium Gr01-1014_70]|nr:MAG: hypothetical protein G01um101470_248 [Parcubacteria group bacterium Gr01-1014_70]